ncbi:MAG: GAF domain-containing protein [Spirochaetes bacterium]|nr:GAF domain-containing protein [Spirochaetota bacterium]
MQNNITADIKLQAFIKAAHMILRKHTFDETARIIFDYCCEATGAESGYIALLRGNGKENEILFLESGGMDCSADTSLPMSIRGLQSLAYTTHRTVYENDFMNSEWGSFMPYGHIILRNVIFAPVNIQGKTAGIITLANKPADFTDDDAEIASAFAELTAIALHNSRQSGLLKEKTVLFDLAMSKIQALSGLAPLCSRCKKVQDDEGFRAYFENYITGHRKAEIARGLCPDCLREVYPDYYDRIINLNKKNEDE